MIVMNQNANENIPAWEKVTLTINEAAEYSNIGVHKIRALANRPGSKFGLYVGKRLLIKRKEFEKYLSENDEI